MFDQIIGHEGAKKILAQQLNHGILSHAYLFYGPSGCGKRSLAYFFLGEWMKQKAIHPEHVLERIQEANHPDFLLVVPDGKTIKISQIRKILDTVQTKPAEGGERVILIDQAEKMTAEAQNALLKTLEEPPVHNTFVLVSSRPDLLLPTVQSRCEKLQFQELNADELEEVLKHLGKLPQSTATSVEEALWLSENPQEVQLREEALGYFHELLHGKGSAVFQLSALIKDHNSLANDMLDLFMLDLSELYKLGQIEAAYYTKAQAILIEMIERLQYNINLRIQWENCFIQLKNLGV